MIDKNAPNKASSDALDAVPVSVSKYPVTLVAVTGGIVLKERTQMLKCINAFVVPIPSNSFQCTLATVCAYKLLHRVSWKIGRHSKKTSILYSDF